jgi:hypothetical protein
MANTTTGKFWRKGLVVLALAVAGCGDSGTNLAQYVGTWKYTTSAARFSCPGQTDQTGPLASMKHWGEGVKSALVDLSSSCDYLFDVQGMKAIVQKDQKCTFIDNTGAPADETPNSWVFTLLSASTADEVVSTVTTFMGGTICTLTAMSTLDKISKD